MERLWNWIWIYSNFCRAFNPGAFVFILLSERAAIQQNDTGVQTYEGKYTYHDWSTDNGKPHTYTTAKFVWHGDRCL